MYVCVYLEEISTLNLISRVVDTDKARLWDTEKNPLPKSEV